jgi:hypothetical protein
MNTELKCARELEAGAVVAEEYGETFTVTDVIKYADYTYAHGIVTTTQEGREWRVAPIGATARVRRIYKASEVLTVEKVRSAEEQQEHEDITRTLWALESIKQKVTAEERAFMNDAIDRIASAYGFMN